MRIVVVADTHLRTSDLSVLPGLARRAIIAADAVIHAGDVVSAAALGSLRDLAAPSRLDAVLGNNDHELVGVLPETAELDIEGVRIAVVHDCGRAAGREGRLRRRFPGAAVVVFGHSHVPCNEIGIGGQILFNPGSPTQRRAQPHRTIGHLDLDAGRVIRREIVAI